MPYATFLAHRRPHGLAVRRTLGAVIAAAATLLRTWRDRRLNREYLRTASDRELRDLGMSRYEAQREAAKGFWQL